MLRQLYVQNVAVIQKAVIEFKNGLNVFTGETGAGKTILISAIDAVLGQRSSHEMIRSGEEKATVSALFEDISPRAKAKLLELGFEDEDGSVLITREITKSGKSLCRIGGIPATASMLKEISSLLIHIHGQRDQSRLLLSENHIELIDTFGEFERELVIYRKAYGNMRDAESRIKALDMDDAQKNQRIDMLSFQVKEIENAGLSDVNEEDELLARKKIIRNSEKILDGLSAGYAALRGDGEIIGIESLFGELVSGVGAAAEYIEPLLKMSERLNEINYELSDFSAEIRAYLDDFDFDPRELDEIESRLDVIYKLKRKYGSNVAEIIAFGENAAAELLEIETSGERKEKLIKELEHAREQAEKLSRELSKKRLAVAKEFTVLIEAELAFLDMPSVRFNVSHSKKELSSDGIDELAFTIAANAGEPLKPLSKIASGGELSRIMLAVKNVLADKDDIDTLIFDEVDTGVSGRAAQKIGRKLKQASSERQVICVTHLAQVAAFADYHILIHKHEKDGKTYTKVSPLDTEKSIAELARITGGELITELSLQSARELWEHSRQG